MRKKLSIVILIAALILLFILVDNKFLTYKSYIYKISDNEQVKVTLKIKDGYRMNGKDFTIGTNLNKVCTVGQFLTKNVYDELKESLRSDENIKIIEEDKVDNLEYILYVKNKTYIYLVKIVDSDIYFTLTNNISIETAIKIFNRLKVEIK